jgi:hypothetical protein
VLDRAPPQPQPDQLRARDHPVLSSRELGDRALSSRGLPASR